MVAQLAARLLLTPVLYNNHHQLLNPVKPLPPSPQWANALRQASIRTELAVLALKTFGVSDEVLQEIYGVDVQSALQDGLKHGRDSTVPASLEEEHDCVPVGKKALEDLLSSPPSTFEHRRLETHWELTDKILTVARRDRPTSEPCWRVKSSPDRNRWSEEIRGLLVSKTSNLELLLLLPLPCDQSQAGKWHLLHNETIARGEEAALRVLAGLSILGLSHRHNLTRTELLPKLVVACADLFAEVGVCKAKGLKLPHNKDLREQTADGTQGLLLFRQHKQGSSRARPFVVDFSRIWRDTPSPHRIKKWNLRDRAGDADEVGDALLQPLTHASGVCLRLSLTPRKSEPLSHAVLLLGPASWIEFLHKGHAENRNKETFEPRQNVGKPGTIELYMDAPSRAKAASDPTSNIRRQRKPSEQKKTDAHTDTHAPIQKGELPG